MRKLLPVVLLLAGACMARRQPPVMFPIVLWDAQYTPTATDPVELTATPDWGTWWPIRKLSIHRTRGMYSRDAVLPEILKYVKQEGGHAFHIADDGKSPQFVTMQNVFGATRTGVANSNYWEVVVYRRASAR